MPNYTFYAGKTSTGGNFSEQFDGKSAAELAALCNAQPFCKGFTSSGLLKSSIKWPALWANWSSALNAGPCDGLFVRNDADYEGKCLSCPSPPQLPLQCSCVYMGR